MRGLIYASLGEEPLAEESFKRALQLNPRDADAMHNYGWYLCQQRRYDEANAHVRSGARHAAIPRPGAHAASAGRLPGARRQAGAGRAALQRAYEVDPTNPNTAFNLSEVLYRRGDYERARFYIRRINGSAEVANAQTLWLATRIENRLGNRRALPSSARQLRTRFPHSPRGAAFDTGRFDD